MRKGNKGKKDKPFMGLMNEIMLQHDIDLILDNFARQLGETYATQYHDIRRNTREALQKLFKKD
jgi:hypothetical protein